MRRLTIAGLLGLALILPTAVSAAPKYAPTLDLIDSQPYSYADVISVVIHGDVPGRPGEPTPKTHLRLDCAWSAGVFTKFVYSPESEVPIPFPLGYGPDFNGGISDWDLAGGGPADCTIALYRVSYHPVWYAYTETYDLEAFHVGA